LGWYHTERGDHHAAIAMCESALDIFTELGDAHGQALTWDSLGRAHHHLGRHARAVECYRTAVEMHGESGSEHYAADSQVHLGDAYAAAGDPEAARAVWRDALVVLRRLGAPGASAVRERLARLAW
jgi:tetratricopeptide (TPR) repeat protein